MSNTIRLTSTAVVLALGLVAASFVVSRFFLNIRHEKAITVKGYAEADLVSDIGSFSCSVSVRATDLKEAFAKLQASKGVMLDYLRGKGFAEPEIRVDTISTSKVNKKNSEGNDMNEVEFVDAYQNVRLTSTNVSLIREVSTSATELIREGVDISVSAPEFVVSDLKDVKVRLLAQATEDGYRRALALAENSRARVGGLVSAEQGVLQITQRHSTDTSGSGMYDTSTIEKTIKAIVSLEYTIVPKK
jgi:hypothetical protein